MSDDIGDEYRATARSAPWLLTEFLAFAGELGFELTGAFPVNRDKWLRILDMDCLFVARPA